MSWYDLTIPLGSTYSRRFWCWWFVGCLPYRCWRILAVASGTYAGYGGAPHRGGTWSLEVTGRCLGRGFPFYFMQPGLQKKRRIPLQKQHHDYRAITGGVVPS